MVVVRAGGVRAWFGGVLEPADTDALAAWIAAGAPGQPPARLAARQFEPDATALGVMRPLPHRGDRLAGLVESALAADAGAWTMGVPGAVAEFAFDGDQPAVARRGRTVEAVTPRGGLRIEIGDATRAFVLTDAPGSTKVIALYLAVPRAAAAGPTRRLAVLGPDHGALRPADRADTLVDLGVGHATTRFSLRTSDADLLARLRPLGGSTWPEVLDQAGGVIVERSPHRVVTTPVGRAEVYSPIPPPGGSSPDGPHTHLLGGEIELGRELPAGVLLPPGLAPAAALHPLPGWRIFPAANAQ